MGSTAACGAQPRLRWALQGLGPLPRGGWQPGRVRGGGWGLVMRSRLLAGWGTPPSPSARPIISRARQLRHCSAAKGGAGVPGGGCAFTLNSGKRHSLIWKYTEKTASIPKFLERVDILRQREQGGRLICRTLGRWSVTAQGAPSAGEEERWVYGGGGGQKQVLPPLRAEERACSPSCIPAPQRRLLVIPLVAYHTSEEQACLYIARMPI